MHSKILTPILFLGTRLSFVVDFQGTLIVVYPIKFKCDIKPLVTFPH